jgi:hypothetical protein
LAGIAEQTSPAMLARNQTIVFMMVTNFGYGDLGCYGSACEEAESLSDLIEPWDQSNLDFAI